MRERENSERICRGKDQATARLLRPAAAQRQARRGRARRDAGRDCRVQTQRGRADSLNRSRARGVSNVADFFEPALLRPAAAVKMRRQSASAGKEASELCTSAPTML